MKRPHRRWAAPAALSMTLLVLAVTLAACGSGGGGGGGGSPTSPPPPPQSGLTFTPNGSGAGISLVTGAGSVENALNLNVQSSGIQDLYGVAFHLTYPSNVMHFTGGSEGPLLNAGGTATVFQVVESTPGTLVVGLTRLGAVPGTSAAGALCVLHFTAVASGNGTLAFSANQAANSTGGVITGISWNAGTVQSTLAASSTSSSLAH